MDGRLFSTVILHSPLSSRIFPVLLTFQRGRSEHTNRKHPMKKHQLLAVFLCSLTPLAQAETDLKLDEIVVTATRVEQSLKRSLSSTSVITRADIVESQAVDVPSVLKNLAGIELYQSGGTGKQSSLFMRGSNSSHVLVLLDGARINSATSGATATDQIMLDQVERIEVVRGNASSLYGSEAIGGVIQIFTRRAKGEMAFNGSAGIGSHNLKRASAGFGGQTGDTDFNLQVSKYQTDGISTVNPAIVSNVNPDNDGYDNTSVTVYARHAINPANSVSASLFDSAADSQTDNPYGLITDINSNKSHLQKAAITLENILSENWQSKLQLSQGLDDIQNYKNGSPDASLGAQFKTTSNLLSWQNQLHVRDEDILMLGLDSLKQQVASSTLYTRTDRTDDSQFAGYTGNYGVHQVQVNARRDVYSDFGEANTWLLGYGVDLNTAWRVTTSTATAFKAPTLNDLFYPFTSYGAWGSYQGNPNLKPERSRDSELGLHYSNEGQRVDVTYFDNRISDLIVNDYQFAATMVNLDEARIDGWEVSYNGQFGDTEARFTATGQNPRNAQTGEMLLRRAKFFSNMAIIQSIGAWKVGGELQYSDERKDIDINTFSRTTLPAYSQVNLTARYQLDKHLDVSLRADNLFNANYMLAHGYNTFGRTLFVGVNYQ